MLAYVGKRGGGGSEGETYLNYPATYIAEGIWKRAIGQCCSDKLRTKPRKKQESKYIVWDVKFGKWK